MVWGVESLKGVKYPAKEHAKRVYNHFLEKNPTKAKGSAFYIAGDGLEMIKYCDQTKGFRQNRYFFYLSGCEVPGAHLFYDTVGDHLTLYLPDIDWEDVMWSGMPLSIEQAKERFNVDDVQYVTELPKRFDGFANKNQIYTLDLNEFNKQFHHYAPIVSDPDFFYALDESRLIKDDFEIAMMKHAAKITDNCHIATMEATPITTNECHIHAEFMYHALRQGSKNQSYDPICCAGEHGSTLHYVTNDQPTDGKHTVLIDAGAEWHCYASDVTRCFPINGSWTKEHLDIYNSVLRMQSETMKLMKPGALWDDLHLLAHKILIEQFLELGIFKSDLTKEEIFDSKVSAKFFPHGLGHVLGLDTHDTAGYPNYEDPDPMLAYLRLRRKLLPGMVVTNEPGIYFSPTLLKEILEGEKSKYINKDVLEKYWYIGGVRIEDDILITKDGYENFTGVTSDPKEIEAIVQRGLQKKFHNVV